MKELQPLPINPFPQEEYKSYFGLFQNKPALLSQIFKESVPLGHAVRRLVQEGTAIGIKVQKVNGKRDVLVKLK